MYENFADEMCMEYNSAAAALFTRVTHNLNIGFIKPPSEVRGLLVLCWTICYTCYIGFNKSYAFGFAIEAYNCIETGSILVINIIP